MKTAWDKLEASGPRPDYVRGIVSMNYREFLRATKDQSAKDGIAASLYAGNVYILKGAFSAGFMWETKAAVRNYFAGQPSTFHKMLEGCPDFHRQIDEQTGKKYSFPCCKHSYYFYRWNGDPLGLFDAVDEVWRPMKLLMGLPPLAYELNTPKDGVVDRLQIVRYLPGIGSLAPHSDPYLHQRLFLSGYMSKRGVDYRGGGFYLVGPDGAKVEVEDRIDTGDVAIGYATLQHGVDPCEGEPDWERDDGRWFLSMYSNASDEVAERHTGHPVELAA